VLGRKEADEVRCIVERALESVDAARQALTSDPEAAIDDLAATRLLLLTALTRL